MTLPRRVLFLSKASDDASTRYRARQFFPQFAAADWQAEHAVMPNSVATWLAIRPTVERSDVVVVLRKLLPEPVCWLLRRWSRRLIFDFDDAVFCRDTGEASRRRMRRFRAIVRRADAVWCGNDYLTEIAQRNRDGGFIPGQVSTIPTALDPHRYRPAVHASDDVVLAWIGSSSTRRYIEALFPTLSQLAKRHSNIRLRVISDFSVRAGSIPVESVRWTSESEAGDLAECDIGLAPLPHNSWTQGKCGCKVLQYMASGLPVVSSRIPAQQRLLGDDCGLIADTDATWGDALSSLIESAELRRQMGLAAVERVAANYSIEAVFPQMLSTLEFLTHRRESAQTRAA